MSKAISVKIFPCKLPTVGKPLSFISFLIAIAILGLSPEFSQSGTSASQSAQPAGITITADRLVTDNRAKISEFTGNVKVTRSGGVITSDRLKVYYTNSSGSNTGGASIGTAIKKIVAEGNVHIHSAELVAVAPKGVYNNKTKIITLSGKGTKVTSGGNSITGSTIILIVDKDRIRVTGDPQNRVKVIFDPASPKK
jgi:lipopolysaccharide export system protein LptA